MSDDKNQNQQSNEDLDDEEEMPEALGILVRYYREMRGMSLQDVYEISGVSPSYVNRLERNERKSPTVKTLKKVTSGLRIPAELIFEIIFNEKVSLDKELSLEALLICSDYVIKGEPAGAEIKQLLVELMKHVFTCDWTADTKMREAYKLAEIIDRIRKIA
jgi:transcriptional regulator with XRE-family HTH domain